MAAQISIQDSLTESRKNVLRKAIVFDESAEKLRFEGKARFRVNAGRSARLLRALESALSVETRLEEEKLFPYAGRRIPRLEVLLYYFRTEHGELHAQIQKLKFLLHLLERSSAAVFPAQVVQEARLGAMRLAAHVAEHIRQEDEELIAALDAEFHLSEKKAFLRLVRSRPIMKRR